MVIRVIKQIVFFLVLISFFLNPSFFEKNTYEDSSVSLSFFHINSAFANKNEERIKELTENLQKNTMYSQAVAGVPLLPNLTEEEQQELAWLFSLHLEEQEKLLSEIEDEKSVITKNLITLTTELTNKTYSTYNEFNNLKIQYNFNKNEPVVITRLEEKLKFYINELSLLSQPLSSSYEHAQSRIVQLENIKNNLANYQNSIFDDVIKRTETLIIFYKNMARHIEDNIPISRNLLTELETTNKEFEDRMPELWEIFYKTGAFSDLYEEIQLNELANTITSVADIKTPIELDTAKIISYTNDEVSLLEIISQELPSTISIYMNIIIKILLIVVGFALVLFLITKVCDYLPSVFGEQWKKILTKSMPYIVLGVALNIGAWHEGIRYQMITMLGTFLQAYGQIRFAWQLYTFNRKEKFIDNLLGESPFLIIFYVLVVSLFIVAFMPNNFFSSFIWLAVLIFSMYRFSKSSKKAPFLTQFLLYSLNFVFLVSIFITIIGFVRFSILLTICYSCLVVGIHQLDAYVHVSSVASHFLPKRGIPSLLIGLLGSIILPVLLVIALLAPFTWVLALPGGKHVMVLLGRFKIQYGEISSDLIQLLVILVLFYLIKSIIRTSCDYIDNAWKKDVSEVTLLATPIKSSITFGLWGVFILYLLSVLGVNLMSISYLGAGLGVGIGLGLQNIVLNVMSGFSLIFGRSIREGDIVDVAGISGTVKNINLRTTRLLTSDNSLIFVPNYEFVSKSFKNYTYNGKKTKKSLLVTVTTDINVKELMDAVLAIANSHTYVLRDPQPKVIFKDMNSDTLELELSFWIENISFGTSTSTDIRLEINKYLNGLKKRNN